MDFYTNVVRFGKKILYRGVENGKRIKLKLDYQPTLYVPSNKPTSWKSLDDNFLEPIPFEDMKAAREFVKQYGDVSNFKIFGNTNFQYSFIADMFKGQLEWDIDMMKISVMDIEVGSENGFPDPLKAVEPITAITITEFGGKSHTFGCGDYVKKDNEVYYKCSSEIDLCTQFLSFWERHCPDILTGWNSKYFDIPYLFNRFSALFGEKEAKRLSPWGMVNTKTAFQRLTGKEITFYDVVGVNHLDYIDLYKNFAKKGKNQENYRLDTVANSELGDGKLSYDEYDNLHQLYKQNYQKFIEYNIKDTNIIVRFEDKLKLIELALTLAYDTKSLPEDVFTQTRMWDANIYNYLLGKNIIVPPKEIKDKDEALEGAYVKDPQVGKHYCIASFDLNSLYPHLMMQYNISPECLVEPCDYTEAMHEILAQNVNVDRMLDMRIDLSKLKEHTITPNGQFFRTDKQGFLPEMLEGMYNDRKKYKKLMLQAEQEYENSTDEEEKKQLTKKIARYNNLQMAKKVGLNSAYGAMGSAYFRFFDLRLASAVTLSGQLSIRWIEKRINQYMNNILKTESDYVIASDTDSIYLDMQKLVEMVFGKEVKNIPVDKMIEVMDRICDDRLQPHIDQSYQDLAYYVNAYDQKMKMKREALADSGIWTAKKRYVLNVYNNEGVQYKEPHLKVMGLETAKSSTPSIVREKMKELLKIIVSKTDNDARLFVEDFRSEFKKLPPEVISFPRGVNNLIGYTSKQTIFQKGCPIHVRGSLIYNHYIVKNGLDKKYQSIKEGEKIKFVYLKEPNPVMSNIISFPGRLPTELNLGNYIDYNTQFEKTFLEPMKVVFHCIGWDVEEKTTLERFF